MNARMILYALAAVIAIVGLVLYLAAQRGRDPLRRNVDRVAGHLLWLASIATMAVGVLGPAPRFDQVDGNLPGGVVLLAASTIALVVVVMLVRGVYLRRARRAGHGRMATALPAGKSLAEG
ncbi:MAG: hypothetical protein U1F10_00880 [Burkholderiales bacterium]